MKDKTARLVIRRLLDEIDSLNKRLSRIEHPHPEQCKCELCCGWTPDRSVMMTVGESFALREIRKMKRY